MASRFLHLRAGASAAARSGRSHHLPAGRTWAPALDPTIGALAEAGNFTRMIPAVQGLRYYGAPFNRDTGAAELSRPIRKEKKKLYAPEQKPSVEEILKSLQRNHEKLEMSKGFNQITKVVMAVGYSITFGAIIYHHVL